MAARALFGQSPRLSGNQGWNASFHPSKQVFGESRGRWGSSRQGCERPTTESQRNPRRRFASRGRAYTIVDPVDACPSAPWTSSRSLVRW